MEPIKLIAYTFIFVSRANRFIGKYAITRKGEGSFPFKMATSKDLNKEAEFLNFLTKYDLEKYHQGFINEGVKKIEHLGHIKEEDLANIGLTRPERQRLLDKYERHFSKLGKFKVCRRFVAFGTCMGTHPY